MLADRGRTERRHHLGHSSGDRRAERERISSCCATARSQGLVPLLQASLSGAQSHLGDDGRSTRILGATRRNGTLREQTFGACLFGSGAVDDGTRLGRLGFQRCAIRTGSETRLQPAQDLIRPHARADRQQHVGDAKSQREHPSQLPLVFDDEDAHAEHVTEPRGFCVADANVRKMPGRQPSVPHTM